MSIHTRAVQATDVLAKVCHDGRVLLSDDDVDVEVIDELNHLNLVTITRGRVDEPFAEPTALGIMFNNFRLRLEALERTVK